MPSPTVLLIRADDATHHALRTRLERRGCRVVEAASQREAVRLAEERAPDLVVQEEAGADRHAIRAVVEAVAILAGPLPHRRPRRPVRRRRRGAQGWRECGR